MEIGPKTRFVSASPASPQPGAAGVASPGMAGDAATLSKAAPRLPFAPGQFFLGANLPWINYGQDFGANAWQTKGGLATPERQAQLDQALGKLAAAGVTHTRWFMLCNGSAGVKFAADGTPTGLDPFVFKDLDTAIAAAKKHGIQITFSLLDFGWGKEGKMVGGVQTGGHADVLADPAKRKALVDKVLTPILQRYGQEPTVEAWEVMNEPEWIVRGMGSLLSWTPWRGVSKSDMRAFLKDGVDAIHRYATQPATVGSASARTLGLVQGLGLDFYQAHWYDWMDRGSKLDQQVKGLKLDKPLILGEFPAKGSKKSPDDILSIAHQDGYAGAFAWSYNATDEFSDGKAVVDASHRFIQAHPGEVVP